MKFQDMVGEAWKRLAAGPKSLGRRRFWHSPSRQDDSKMFSSSSATHDLTTFRRLEEAGVVTVRW